jgi:hypothetical protein
LSDAVTSKNDGLPFLNGEQKCSTDVDPSTTCRAVVLNGRDIVAKPLEVTACIEVGEFRKLILSLEGEELWRSKILVGKVRL